MKKYTLFLIRFLMIGALLTNCQNQNATDEHGHEYHDSHDAENTIVHLTKAQEEAIQLQLGQIEMRAISSSIDVTGKLDTYARDRARISPLMSGIVQEIRVKEGDYVNKGQTLFVLVNPQIIEEQQRYNQLHKSLTFLKQEYERSKKLFDNEVSSEKSYQKAQADYNIAKAEYEGLEKKLQLLGFNTAQVKAGNLSSTMSIQSPISGFINEVHINLGQFVDDKDQLVSITDNKKVHADFMVYESDFPKVQNGQVLEFTISGQPTKTYQAKVSSIGQNLEDNTRAVHIHASISTPDVHLIPGMYISGRLLIDNVNVPALPRTSIVTNEQKSFIFIKEKEAESYHYRMVEVQIGIEDKNYIEVILPSDISTDTEIVTYGAYFLEADLNRDDFEDHDH
ncbi:MAG: efflux RND transporter periplasmic adaptor subunit [Chitinophagales bacterium]|nr:efflux RND transporter periplasmic adaptor subunit [Chitinophagales bacterium]